MAEFERDFIIPPGSRFQPIISYREVEKAPPVIARQTHTLLDLLNQGAIKGLGSARDYLHDYTLKFLDTATIGSDMLYDRFRNSSGEIVDLESREAADYALVVFSCLPDRAKSPFLPMGFSRKGMLKPPITHGEFLLRIQELKVGVWQVVDGKTEPHSILETDPSLLRVHKFFEVGSNLAIKEINQKEQQQSERWRINHLLDGIQGVDTL